MPKNFDLLGAAWSGRSIKRLKHRVSPIESMITKAIFGDHALQRSDVCQGVLISVFCSIAPKGSTGGRQQPSQRREDRVSALNGLKPGEIAEKLSVQLFPFREVDPFRRRRVGPASRWE